MQSTVSCRLPNAGLTRPPLHRRAAHVCAAQKDGETPVQVAANSVVGSVAAVGLSLAAFAGSAVAGEFEVLTEPTPTTRYVLDDASVLSKNTKGTLNSQLKALEDKTGYRLEVVTVRKLEYETDPFAFGDKVIERWFPTLEEGTSKGILLVVTSSKDGALTGGPAFLKGVGDPLIDSLISNDIPILTEQEKFNETVLESTKRIDAVLRGEEDPGGPVREEKARKRTYKTKTETEKSKNVTSTVVATLLFISVVVPMLQYYGYTSKE